VVGAREEVPEALFDNRAVGHELRSAGLLDSEAEKSGLRGLRRPLQGLLRHLHYDPYDQRTRQGLSSGTPLARRRMDFLLLFGERQRVVIEVDGKQHLA
jgi:hypothetical protein